MIDWCKKREKENKRNRKQNNKNKEWRNNKLKGKLRKWNKKLRNIIVPPFYSNLIPIQELVIGPWYIGFTRLKRKI